MAQFDTVLPALTQGRSVRRNEWEPKVRMYVLEDTLMCQCGNMNPWHHSLTWAEITAPDWQIIQAESAVEQENHMASASTPVSRLSGWAFRKPFSGSGALHSALFFRSFLKWWNIE